MILRTNGELPIASSLLRFALIGMTGVLAVLAVVCSLFAWRYQQHLMEASRYDGAFDFSQACVELLRLQTALDDARRSAAPALVNLRYGIMRNRIGVIEGNGFLDIGRLAPIQAIKVVLDQIAPLIAQGTDQGYAESTALLRPLNGPLLRLASEAQSDGGDMVMQVQQNLRRILIVICGITLTLFVVGATLIAVVARQYRRLYRIARTDALTGLANRSAFNHALRTSAGSPRAMVLVDVDHFKAVNDTLGHDAGDRLLCALTSRLAVAAHHATTLARIGGDEFAVLFSGADAGPQSVAFAQEVHAVMHEPVTLDGREVVSTVTQGICISDGQDSASLFNDADIALYAAKIAGRDSFLVFESAMKLAFTRRQRLLEDLRQAVVRRELFLLFQPIVRLSDDRIEGVEALLRWQHPQYGSVSPAEFIPIAEESGIIQEIGRWVIDQACRQTVSWPQALFVAVNVSARQLNDATFASYVADRLAAHGLSHDRLEIEITESILIENNEIVLQTLKQLRILGCRVALDDFGTGYASLSYLHRFRFDKLKIDRSFIQDNGRDDESTAIVSMICDLAHRLQLTIVAEGIETSEQRDSIQIAGGQMGQGYYFSRPVSATIVEQLLKRDQYEECTPSSLMEAAASKISLAKIG